MASAAKSGEPPANEAPERDEPVPKKRVRLNEQLFANEADDEQDAESPEIVIVNTDGSPLKDPLHYMSQMVDSNTLAKYMADSHIQNMQRAGASTESFRPIVQQPVNTVVPDVLRPQPVRLFQSAAMLSQPTTLPLQLPHSSGLMHSATVDLSNLRPLLPHMIGMSSPPAVDMSAFYMPNPTSAFVPIAPKPPTAAAQPPSSHYSTLPRDQQQQAHNLNLLAHAASYVREVGLIDMPRRGVPGFPQNDIIRSWIREARPSYDKWGVAESYDFARFIMKRVVQQVFLEAADEATSSGYQKITPQHMLNVLRRNGA